MNDRCCRKEPCEEERVTCLKWKDYGAFGWKIHLLENAEGVIVLFNHWPLKTSLRRSQQRLGWTFTGQRWQWNKCLSPNMLRLNALWHVDIGLRCPRVFVTYQGPPRTTRPDSRPGHFKAFDPSFIHVILPRVLLQVRHSVLQESEPLVSSFSISPPQPSSGEFPAGSWQQKHLQTGSPGSPDSSSAPSLTCCDRVKNTKSTSRHTLPGVNRCKQETGSRNMNSGSRRSMKSNSIKEKG